MKQDKQSNTKHENRKETKHDQKTMRKREKRMYTHTLVETLEVVATTRLCCRRKPLHSVAYSFQCHYQSARLIC